jgi:hypothetical protein
MSLPKCPADPRSRICVQQRRITRRPFGQRHIRREPGDRRAGVIQLSMVPGPCPMAERHLGS